MLNKGGLRSAKMRKDVTITYTVCTFSHQLLLEWGRSWSLKNKYKQITFNRLKSAEFQSEPINVLFDQWVGVCSPSSIQVIPSDQMSTFPSYWPSSMARITSGAILNTKADTRTHAYAHTLSSMEKNPWKCYNLLSFSEFLKTLVCCDSSLVFGIYVSILVWQFFVCMTTSPPVYGMPLFTIKAAVNMWVNILF